MKTKEKRKGSHHGLEKGGQEMKIYAFTNRNVELPQISESIVTWGPFEGQKIERYFSVPRIRDRNGKLRSFRKEDDGELQLLDTAQEGDAVVTSTLVNFSHDFPSAMGTISKLSEKGVRIFAEKEDFDSESETGKALIMAFPLIKSFGKNSRDSKNRRRLSGIKRAKEEGRYQGKKAYDPDDFPAFHMLYDSYMSRRITKSDFAKELEISRPTLDRLIESFKKEQKQREKQ